MFCQELGLLKHYHVDLKTSHINCDSVTKKRKYMANNDRSSKFVTVIYFSLPVLNDVPLKGEVSSKFSVISKPKNVCLSAETKK